MRACACVCTFVCLSVCRFLSLYLMGNSMSNSIHENVFVTSCASCMRTYITLMSTRSEVFTKKLACYSWVRTV